MNASLWAWILLFVSGAWRQFCELRSQFHNREKSYRLPKELFSRRRASRGFYDQVANELKSSYDSNKVAMCQSAPMNA